MSGKKRPRCKVLLLVAHADDEIIFAGRGIAQHCFVSVFNFEIGPQRLAKNNS